MLRAHVDDDPLLTGGRRVDDVVPVLTDDVERHILWLCLGGALGGVLLRHQLYALRSSGGGIVAPLYSTAIPPSG